MAHPTAATREIDIDRQAFEIQYVPVTSQSVLATICWSASIILRESGNLARTALRVAIKATSSSPRMA